MPDNVRRNGARSERQVRMSGLGRMESSFYMLNAWFLLAQTLRHQRQVVLNRCSRSPSGESLRTRRIHRCRRFRTVPVFAAFSTRALDMALASVGTYGCRGNAARSFYGERQSRYSDPWRSAAAAHFLWHEWCTASRRYAAPVLD